jgi:hypothetical protein
VRFAHSRLVRGFFVAAAAAAVGLAPSTASAGAVSLTPIGNGICDPGEFCLYRDSNRTGPVRSRTTTRRR